MNTHLVAIPNPISTTPSVALCNCRGLPPLLQLHRLSHHRIGLRAANTISLRSSFDVKLRRRQLIPDIKACSANASTHEYADSEASAAVSTNGGVVVSSDSDAGTGTSNGSPVISTVTKPAGNPILNALQNANKLIPYVVLGSTILALAYPPSFSWFTNKYYTPALGFLMFAVGINLNYSDFVSAFKRPKAILLGYIGQYVVKPLLGVLFAHLAVSRLHLPESIGSGIILVSCVSGAQLSNYATFLVEPAMAPLSIVMTAISTATAVLVIPALTRVLLGQRLPVDVRAMMFDITQIVVAPVTAGLALKQFAPWLTKLIKPFLPIISVIVTGLCMGSPLANNINAVKSPFGVELALPIIGLHAAAFTIGHKCSGLLFHGDPDRKALQRAISFETGMQSSLLGLTLANKYFSDPLVGLPSALSTVLMSLMGFGLVVYWNAKKERQQKAASSSNN